MDFTVFIYTKTFFAPYSVDIGKMSALQLGSCDKVFDKNFLYCGSYNLKNARNGKSMSRIAVWPCLRLQAGVNLFNSFNVFNCMAIGRGGSRFTSCFFFL